MSNQTPLKTLSYAEMMNLCGGTEWEERCPIKTSPLRTRVTEAVFSPEVRQQIIDTITALDALKDSPKDKESALLTPQDITVLLDHVNASETKEKAGDYLTSLQSLTKQSTRLIGITKEQLIRMSPATLKCLDIVVSNSAETIKFDRASIRAINNGAKNFETPDAQANLTSSVKAIAQSSLLGGAFMPRLQALMKKSLSSGVGDILKHRAEHGMLDKSTFDSVRNMSEASAKKFAAVMTVADAGGALNKTDFKALQRSISASKPAYTPGQAKALGECISTMSKAKILPLGFMDRLRANVINPIRERFGGKPTPNIMDRIISQDPSRLEATAKIFQFLQKNDDLKKTKGRGYSNGTVDDVIEYLKKATGSDSKITPDAAADALVNVFDNMNKFNIQTRGNRKDLMGKEVGDLKKMSAFFDKIKTARLTPERMPIGKDSFKALYDNAHYLDDNKSTPIATCLTTLVDNGMHSDTRMSQLMSLAKDQDSKLNAVATTMAYFGAADAVGVRRFDKTTYDEIMRNADSFDQPVNLTRGLEIIQGTKAEAITNTCERIRNNEFGQGVNVVDSRSELLKMSPANMSHLMTVIDALDPLAKKNLGPTSFKKFLHKANEGKIQSPGHAQTLAQVVNLINTPVDKKLDSKPSVKINPMIGNRLASLMELDEKQLAETHKILTHLNTMGKLNETNFDAIVDNAATLDDKKANDIIAIDKWRASHAPQTKLDDHLNQLMKMDGAKVHSLHTLLKEYSPGSSIVPNEFKAIRECMQETTVVDPIALGQAMKKMQSQAIPLTKDILKPLMKLNDQQLRSVETVCGSLKGTNPQENFLDSKTVANVAKRAANQDFNAIGIAASFDKMREKGITLKRSRDPLMALNDAQRAFADDHFDKDYPNSSKSETIIKKGDVHNLLKDLKKLDGTLLTTALTTAKDAREKIAAHSHAEVKSSAVDDSIWDDLLGSDDQKRTEAMSNIKGALASANTNLETATKVYDEVHTSAVNARNAADELVNNASSMGTATVLKLAKARSEEAHQAVTQTETPLKEAQTLASQAMVNAEKAESFGKQAKTLHAELATTREAAVSSDTIAASERLSKMADEARRNPNILSTIDLAIEASTKAATSARELQDKTQVALTHANAALKTAGELQEAAKEISKNNPARFEYLAAKDKQKEAAIAYEKVSKLVEDTKDWPAKLEDLQSAVKTAETLKNKAAEQIIKAQGTALSAIDDSSPKGPILRDAAELDTKKLSASLDLMQRRGGTADSLAAQAALTLALEAEKATDKIIDAAKGSPTAVAAASSLKKEYHDQYEIANDLNKNAGVRQKALDKSIGDIKSLISLVDKANKSLELAKLTKNGVSSTTETLENKKTERGLSIRVAAVSLSLTAKPSAVGKAQDAHKAAIANQAMADTAFTTARNAVEVATELTKKVEEMGLDRTAASAKLTEAKKALKDSRELQTKSIDEVKDAIRILEEQTAAMKQAQQSSVVAAEEGRPEVPLAPAASENAPLGTTLSRLADSTPTILDTDEASDDTDNVFHNPSS